MKILYYELRKEFIRKSFFMLFVTLVVMNIFWMEWDYRTNAGFTDDFVKVNASDKEESYYKELHNKLDGKLNSEKVSYVSDEYQKYHSLVSDDYSKEYDEKMHTGYVFGDYSLLTVHFYNPIKYLVTYKEQNEKFVSIAEDNLDFFTEKNNKYEIEKNTYILEHYKNRNPVCFYETSGWEHLFSYDKSDLFILVLLMIGIIPVFSREEKNGMETIQITSVCGRKMFIPAKLMAHIVVAIVLEFCFCVLNFLIIHMQYGLSGSEMMLYSISDYQYTPFNVSVMEFYLILVLSKCIGFSFITIIMTLIARFVKNTYSVFLLMIGFVCCFLYFSGFNNGITMFEKVLTLLSPFSLLKIGEIAMYIREVRICGHFVTLHSGLFGIQCIMIILLLIVLYLIEKKGEVIR